MPKEKILEIINLLFGLCSMGFVLYGKLNNIDQSKK